MPEQYHTLFFHRFLIAIRFLTYFPVSFKNKLMDKDIGCSVSFYPVVGLALGVVLYATLYLLQLISLPLTSAMLASILLTVWVMLSGAKHLKGFAQGIEEIVKEYDSTQSKLLNNVDKQNYVGTLSIVLILLLKWSALESIITMELAWTLIFIPILPRAFSFVLLNSKDFKKITTQVKTEINNYFPDQTHVNTILFTTALVLIFSLGWLYLLFSIALFLMLKYLLSHYKVDTNSILDSVIEVTEVMGLVFIIVFI